MRITTAISLMACLVGFAAGAATTEATEAAPDRLVIEVRGVVCSFCAYGTEKNLAKLNFLDRTQYGGDGVLLDINTRRITLALQRGKPVRYAAINDAIRQGGYDPVMYHATLTGVVGPHPAGFQLVNEHDGLVYLLPGSPAVAASNGKRVRLRTTLSADQVAKVRSGESVRLSTVSLEVLP